MAIDEKQLITLVKRFKNYEHPSDAQKLLVILGEKPDRSDKDNKVLEKLIKAENRFIRTKRAELNVQNLLAKENDNQRKLMTRKKIIWGAALRSAALANNAEAVAVAKYLVKSGFISPRDFEVIAKDFEAIQALPENKAHSIDLYKSPSQPEFRTPFNLSRAMKGSK